MADDFVIGGLPHQSFDVDADGLYLYIAVLDDSGNPQILKMSTALDEDATLSYDPGSGDYIIVKCGRYESEVVWAAGNFGSVHIVRYNGNQGLYWYDVDWGFPCKVTPLQVGPGNDNLVMITTPCDDTLYESYWIQDSGPYWLEITNILPFDVNAMDRLDIDLDQVMIGVDNDDPYWYPPQYWYPYVEFSWNTGTSFYDISGIIAALGGDCKITSVILG